MDQDQGGENEEDRSEQFFSPGHPATDQRQESQSQPPPTSSQENQAGQGGKQAKNKEKTPCLAMCGKSVTSGAIQCTICSLWCHMTCTKLSKEALKGLEVQAKETGHAYWACRSCMSFNKKWNAHMKESSKKQEATDFKVEDNRKNIEDIRRLLEATRKEVRDLAKDKDNAAERTERMIEEELRERESRRLNLVLHGVPEPGPEKLDPRDRMDADKRECERIFGGMRARTRRHQIRFCRRVGERGNDPRPIVIGLYTEEERRHLLERSRELKNTMYSCVTIVPDMTKSQRRGEMRLREEAERRNHEDLTEVDREKNLKWVVVGSRGEKRLIKGTEREEQYHGGGGGVNGGQGGRGGRGNYPDRNQRIPAGENPEPASQSAIQTTTSQPVTISGGGGGTAPTEGSNNGHSNNTSNRGNYGGGRGSSNTYGYNYGNISYNNRGNNSSGNYGGHNSSSNNSRYGNDNKSGYNNSGNYGGNRYGANGNNGHSNNYNNGYGNNTYRNNSNGGNGYLGGNRGGRGRFTPEYNHSGSNRGGGGGGGGYDNNMIDERPWQETGARRKDGPNHSENYQERDQRGQKETDAEEIMWGPGTLPEPFGAKPRERMNSKRNRSWEEDEEDRDSRRLRS